VTDPKDPGVENADQPQEQPTPEESERAMPLSDLPHLNTQSDAAVEAQREGETPYDAATDTRAQHDETVEDETGGTGNPDSNLEPGEAASGDADADADEDADADADDGKSNDAPTADNA